MEERSRIPEFYKRSCLERLAMLRERALLTEADYQMLVASQQTLSLPSADKMIENVIGVFGLPIGLGLNFLINGKDYVVPMVVEEPSIVAGISAAAKIVRQGGGFTSTSSESFLIGQIQVVGIDHPSKAQHAVIQNKDEILNLANSLHPNMVARGGGARDVEVFIYPCASEHRDMLVVHVLVNTCDAMGANMVNSMCEGVAPLVEKITGGKVFLRILSNLTDRSMVRAQATIPVKALQGKGHAGHEVRDGVILANDFAVVDPYRAATHNKGIMNGIDAVAIATGNDWRAIEAAAHAYAARGNGYSSLTQWYKDDAGNLVGRIDIPIKVGTVGGNLQSNPAVPVLHRLLGVQSARELAEVMASVGLAQNFAALRALVTDGIQAGHMTLHARSVVMAAGASPDMFDTVVERLIESGEIKVWKAQEIVQAMNATPSATSSCAPQTGMSAAARIELQHDTSAMEHAELSPEPSTGVGFGKVVLLGEHAAVYGSHAIAAPVPLAIRAKVDDAQEGVHVVISRWGVEERLRANHPEGSVHASLHLILHRLGLQNRNMVINVFPRVPRAMGLGGSAALAVAVIRALDHHYGLCLTDAEVNDLAFASERLAHGTPSGIDNTLATYGQAVVFQKGTPPKIQPLRIPKPIPLVIGISGIESLTAKMVARVRHAWEQHPALYDRIFAEIDALTLQGVQAIESHDLPLLGDLMNVCHGLLNALQVSSWELEEMIQIARANGAMGAKLTGGGGGGSIVALCPEDPHRVVEALHRSGYQAMEMVLAANI